jgi:hypothetical protein
MAQRSLFRSYEPCVYKPDAANLQRPLRCIRFEEIEKHLAESHLEKMVSGCGCPALSRLRKILGLFILGLRAGRSTPGCYMTGLQPWGTVR